MSRAGHNSKIVQQMALERRAHLRVARLDGAPSTTPDSVVLDSRLKHLDGSQRLSELLHVEDSTERAALLREIQILVDRCHYHQLAILSRRKSRNLRVVRGAAKHLARGRGRPRRAVNFAASQFGLGLATIWWEHTGRQPSRYESERMRKRGSYFEFVHMVVSALPPSLRKMPGGKVPSISYLVTASIKAFKDAMKAPAEYRRRGLIDEQDWLEPGGTVT